MTPRRLGQHFLKDPSVAARIVAAAEPSPDDTVVEIGPGRGALTRRLSDAVGRLVLLEIDAGLASRLRCEYAGDTRVQVVEGDARLLDPAGMPALSQRPYKAIGNLPYYAATPIVRLYLESTSPPVIMVVMVQREVAREMTAEPGKMGLLSVAVQLYAGARAVCTVPPRAFSPPPKVHSTVVRLDVRDRPVLALDSVDDFFTVARAGFSAPRKQLRNSLANGLRVPASDSATLLSDAGIDGTRRPATLSLREWGDLYQAWKQRVYASPEATP